jgi:hypothetical protein
MFSYSVEPEVARILPENYLNRINEPSGSH